MNKISLIISLFFALITLSCNSPLKKKHFVDEKKQNLNPTQSDDYIIHDLPNEIAEISGITFIDDSIVAAIEDESGTLYFYNLGTKAIIKKQKFAKPGDYEDLVKVGADIYITSSGGTIYKIINFASQKPVVKSYDTPFTKKNDIESLAYDKSRNCLLLAPKAQGLDSDETTKQVYAFDLKKMGIISEPVYLINLKEIEQYFKGDAITESSKKLLKAIGNENMNKVFQPSALTINPINKEIYILSSINNFIAVLGVNGKLKKILSYKGKVFQQPEGMAFSSNGNLYVSNEKGKKSAANIIQILYEKK